MRTYTGTHIPLFLTCVIIFQCAMAKRQPNFTFFEKQILIRLLNDYKHIVEDKRTDKRTNKEKEKAWTEITDRFNSEADVNKRTKKQLENCWKALKSKDRDSRAAERREHFRTGGGPPVDVKKDPLCELVAEITQANFDPINNAYDDDSEQLADESETTRKYYLTRVVRKGSCTSHPAQNILISLCI